MTLMSSHRHHDPAFSGSAFVQFASLAKPTLKLTSIANQPPTISTALHLFSNKNDCNDDLFGNSNNMTPTRHISYSKERKFPDNKFTEQYTTNQSLQINELLSNGNNNNDSGSTPINSKIAKKNHIGTAMISLMCSVAFILGNFEGTGLVGDKSIPFFHSEAFAAEPSTVTDIQGWGLPQSSTPSITSEESFQFLSTKLLQKSQSSPTSSSTNQNRRMRYWDAMVGTIEQRSFANEKLMDHSVATINNMFYDTSGGANFDPKEFYGQWVEFRNNNREKKTSGNNSNDPSIVDTAFSTRENTVKAMKNLVSSLHDPYSKYLTREELREELERRDDGFLGLGALVETPSSLTDSLQQVAEPSSSRDLDAIFSFDKVSNRNSHGQWDKIPLDNTFITNFFKNQQTSFGTKYSKSNNNKGEILSTKDASNLPIVTAIAPDSPAERAGIVVGDRIASVGSIQFTGMSRSQVQKTLEQKFRAENYFGKADLTIAKQIVARSLGSGGSSADAYGNIVEEKYFFEDGWYYPRKNRKTTSNDFPREQVLGYKLSHVKSIPTTLTAGPFKPEIEVSGEIQFASSSISSDATSTENTQRKFPSVVGGDSIVHYELLTPNDSIFQQSIADPSHPVGYIRLTRFSKASTSGYINAIKSLEEAGAKSYIIDVRNNYGGVIQEAMLTASTLLRDPHSVLCYTLNSRGGFRPQENQEYITDKGYPGYFLSSEPSTVSRDQVKREHPEYLEDGGWSGPTSYASLRELKATRGIKPPHAAYLDSQSIFEKATVNGEGLERSVVNSGSLGRKEFNLEQLNDAIERSSQKKLVILINEGTASAAEVFASALHDNGRAVALVGTRTFGKGIIQHTFPMPDGGGLRLTVAEYLTPFLQHVTKVGGAKYDSGIHPDILCESNQGIPKNVGADLCVGMALDVLESASNGG